MRLPSDIGSRSGVNATVASDIDPLWRRFPEVLLPMRLGNYRFKATHRITASVISEPLTM